MKTLVVAKFKEDTGWTEKVKDFEIDVFDKGADNHAPWNGTLENVGREANTYLEFIVEAIEGNAVFPDEVVFCQGNPFAHDPDFLKHLNDESVRTFGEWWTCDAKTDLHWADSNLDEYCKVFGLPVQTTYHFTMGAQFRVTVEQINARPLAFYEALLALTKFSDRAPFILERLWPIIFGYSK